MISATVLRSDYASFVDQVGAVDDAALLEWLRDTEDRQRRLEAERAALLIEAERRKVYRVDGHASMWGLLRSMLHWSSGQCRTRMRVARLADRYEDVGELLFDGGLAVDAAEAISRAAANPRCGDQIDQVLGTLLQLGTTAEYDDVLLAAQRWEQLADSDGAHVDAEKCHGRRKAGIHIYDGVGTMTATWGAADAVANQAIFDKFCQAEFTADWDETVARYGDKACAALMPRTAAQRRADALTAIFQAAAATPADANRPEPVVNLVIDLDTFHEVLVDAGLVADGVLRRDAAHGPVTKRHCQTDTGVPVDPLTVLQAAIAGSVRRVVVDRCGQVIEWGRKRRLFSGSARRAVMLQASRCIYPGCRAPLGNCQADHLQAWADDGQTRPQNGGPVCGRHNRFKSRGYRIWRDPGGQWHTYRPDGSEIC